MNPETIMKLDAATRRKYGSRWRKLFDPGVLRFVSRWSARWSGNERAVDADLFFGERMEVVLPDPISEMIFTYGLFDELVSSMASCAVERGDVVFDVGAHFGYLSLLFSHLAGDEGRVVGFEPTPSTFEVLSRNARRRSNITVFNTALGEAAGEVELHDYGVALSAWNTVSGQPRLEGEDAPTERTVHRVALRRLDDVVTELGVKPALIKIDAENYELQVLRGAMNTLSTVHPRVIMETGSPASEPAARLLVDLGYEAFRPERVGALVKVDDPVGAARANKDLLFVAIEQLEAFESSLRPR